MTLRKRSTSGLGNPLWFCESCVRTYTNQAQAITHLVKGHGMRPGDAHGLLDELRTAHNIPFKATQDHSLPRSLADEVAGIKRMIGEMKGVPFRTRREEGDNS